MEKQIKEGKKMVIGSMGTLGSGKGTVSRYLHKKYKFHVITMGNIVREEAAKRGIKKTRENLQALSNKLRGKYGQDYLIKKAIFRIKKSGLKRVLIDGIRSKLESDIWRKEFPAFVLIGVDANKKIRFERLKSRGGPRAPKTWNEFLQHESREENLYPGSSLSSFLASADYKLDNSGSMKQLYRQIDKVLGKILK